MTDKSKDKTSKSLDETQIETDRVNIGRRAVLRGFGVGTLGIGTLAVSGCVVTPMPTPVRPMPGTGFTDSDNGPITDPGGRGRGGPRSFATGRTDSDNGPIVDRVGFGRS